MKYCNKCNYAITDEEAEKNNGLCQKCFDEKKTRSNKWIFILVIVIIISLFFIPSIVQNIDLSIKKSEFKSNVKSLTIDKYEYCKSLTMEGVYNNIITIKTDNNFDKLNYKDMEKIIIDIANNISSKFDEYLSKTNQKSNILNDKSCTIIFNTDNNSYKYNTALKSIKRNNDDYNLRIYLKEAIQNKISDTSYNTYLNNINNTDTLEELLSIDNISDCKNELIYLSAVSYYKSDNFEDAIEEFKSLGEYKDSNKYMLESEIYSQLQGTWKVDYWTEWIIKGKNLYKIYDSAYKKNAYDKYYLIIENSAHFIVSENENNAETSIIYELTYENNELSYNPYGKIITVKKTNTKTELPTTIYIKEPYIGMTKEEAENSTWGSPKKINKTTTSYGVHEQWVYSSNRYLYFENGKLTSIQE